MNISPAIAPPAPFRRRRPLRTEPLVFALFVAALTLGINVAGVTVVGESDSATTEPTRVATAR